MRSENIHNSEWCGQASKFLYISAGLCDPSSQPCHCQGALTCLLESAGEACFCPRILAKSEYAGTIFFRAVQLLEHIACRRSLQTIRIFSLNMICRLESLEHPNTDSNPFSRFSLQSSTGSVFLSIQLNTP